MLGTTRIQRTRVLADQVSEILCMVVIEQLASRLGVNRRLVRKAVKRLVRDTLMVEGRNDNVGLVPPMGCNVVARFLVRSVIDEQAPKLGLSRLMTRTSLHSGICWQAPARPWNGPMFMLVARSATRSRSASVRPRRVRRSSINCAPADKYSLHHQLFATADR